MIGLNVERNATIGKVMPSVQMSSQKSTSKQGHLIIVEGNIGVGKTTLTCQLSRKLDYRIFLEPTSGNPYLAKFYEEPKKYALKMQLWLFRQRCMMYMRAVKHAMKSGVQFVQNVTIKAGEGGGRGGKIPGARSGFGGPKS